MGSAVALVSGGMDSVTLLYKRRNDIEVCVSFDYGSKHNKKEIEFAREHAKKFEKKHVVIYMPFVCEHFKSNLLQSGDAIPDGHYEDEVMKQTVVPFRNGIMLSICIGLAESYGLKRVLIGNHFGDHAIYPDCREKFIKAMGDAASLGTYNEVEVIGPFTEISKREIAIIGRSIAVPYEKTWSCYKGRDLHCGVCGTCVERKEALEGFDPTKYEGE